MRARHRAVSGRTRRTDGGGEVNRKTILALSIVWNVGLLFVFKYLSFAVKNLSLVLPSIPFPAADITLPIGISFFTFQIMSYVFDVYYGKVPVQKNVCDLALYISLFPQLIAGPIVRYETIADEIRNRRENAQDITAGTVRFVIGLGKKCLLANYMAVIADLVFAGDLAVLSGADAWVGIIAYALQIYFDFSGYSDMAIGLGRIFGFHFDENFNYPYTARSATDFWRRWHISLSTWFRDYIYIPLGGNRCSKPRWVFNLFVVWGLTGVWHGANWTFWLWGLYWFALLLAEKLTGFAKKLGVFGHVYALLAVLIGWVLFRSATVSDALLYLRAMFAPADWGSLGANYYLQNGWLMLCIAAVCAFPAAPHIHARLERSSGTAAQAITAAAVLVVFALSALSCIKSSYNPFIYFNF